jgi:hypothetical protein
VWRPVLHEQLAAAAQRGLPEIDAAQVEDYLEALEMASSNGSLAARYRRRLEDAEPLQLAAALLAIVEDREADVIDKRRAYAWLRARGPAAILPRLTLRLKYEKDWPANVDLGLALLRHGSGAGLEAWKNILVTPADQGSSDLQQARFATMEALAWLPEGGGWQAGSGFDADWRRLLQVQDYWLRRRSLPDQEASSPDEDLRAELWRMMARLRSQPLRPVDDARFVLVRAPRWVFEPLCRSIADDDRYVREHVLQTLSWIGYPVGRWARDSGYDLPAAFTTALQDASLRPRALEAMGASGRAEMTEMLLPWLRQGNLEESTAAADALLRCADTSAAATVDDLLSGDIYLSPEARWSLTLLQAALREEPVALDAPADLDGSEARRRREWQERRAQRPQ